MWLESHANLARHPKTRRLMKLLGWSLPDTIGNLHLLWWWALDFAPTGDLTRFAPDQLTADLDLLGVTPEQFIEAMVQSGFLDREEDGVLCIHDWPDYQRPVYTRRTSSRRSGMPGPPPISNSARKSVPAPEQGAPSSAPREPKLVGLALRAGRRIPPSATAENEIDTDAVRADPNIPALDSANTLSNTFTADPEHQSETRTFTHHTSAGDVGVAAIPAEPQPASATAQQLSSSIERKPANVHTYLASSHPGGNMGVASSSTGLPEFSASPVPLRRETHFANTS
jgi:hypothetical protein